MLHPFSSDNNEIKVNLEICTTYNGVPYGPALIKYKDPDQIYNSFKGIGIFN
jgi:hypothetical protein